MWGTVVGDIAGSRFEGSRGGPKDFELFHRLCTYTDDTVCTAAIAYIIVNDRKPDATLQRWCRRHPDRGYGGAFRKWIASDVPAPYGSFGNGAAMRVSPLGIFGWKMEAEALAKAAAEDAALTHPNPICRQVNGLYVSVPGWSDSIRLDAVVLKEAHDDTAVFR